MIVGGTGGKNDAIYGVSRNGGQQDGHHFHRGKLRFWDSLNCGKQRYLQEKLEGCTTASSRSSQSGCTGTCQSVSRSEASPEANGTWGILYWSTGGRRSRSSLIF